MPSSSNINSNNRRQYIYLIRYGLTDPPLLENVGNYDSDIDPQVGVEHAHCIADCLAFLDESIRPSVVFADPFLRCAHTGSIIAEKLQEQLNTCDDAFHLLRIEEGVTEWMVPSLLVDKDGIMTHPKTTKMLSEIFKDTVDTSYTSVNPVVWENGETVSDGKVWFPESEHDLYKRVAVTLTKILQSTTLKNNNIAIVSHAPCLQAMAVVLEGCQDDPTSTKVVKPWNLGGITCFSRKTGDGNNPWKCDYFSSTQHMPTGKYRDGTVGAWSLPTFVGNK